MWVEPGSQVVDVRQWMSANVSDAWDYALLAEKVNTTVLFYHYTTERLLQPWHLTGMVRTEPIYAVYIDPKPGSDATTNADAWSILKVCS